MLKLDTHQHFWKYNASEQSWINDEMAAIQKDFLPNDLRPILEKFEVSGCIAVQADDKETENEFLIGLAEKNEFIKGIIGWVDFLAEDVSHQLAYYDDLKIVKGFRYMFQGKKQRDLMLNHEFITGLSAMKNYRFVYELLILSDQLSYAEKLVAQFPSQVFVLNHLAKPMIKSGEIEQWRTDITAFAKHENVYCKLSGMVNEADWSCWTQSDLSPYMDVVFSVFDMDRVMFGSDWPVCILAGGYEKVIEVVSKQVSPLSLYEQEKFWSGNAIRCYRL